MSERKSFLLRIDEQVLESVKRWADQDLRSLNAQVEFLLRDALRRTGRLPEGRLADSGPSAPDDDGKA